ncbi:MAG TPA: hypothetical protein VGN73_04730 [Gemmatimonadaceae bacterium]|jgi:hypothetical protein|nr:hypothetical protein [Gemmatimonadaceae bacterium]
MDRINSRIAQVYGYAVCFITVITMLISIKQVVDALIDLSDPIRAEGGGYGRMGRPLTNFEVYKMAARREPDPRRPTQAGPAPATTTPAQTTAMADTLSDAELQRMYQAEREEAIGNAKFRATRSLVGNLLLIVLAAILFVVHWRWLKQRDTTPVTP